MPGSLHTSLDSRLRGNDMASCANLCNQVLGLRSVAKDVDALLKRDGIASFTCPTFLGSLSRLERLSYTWIGEGSNSRNNLWLTFCLPYPCYIL